MPSYTAERSSDGDRAQIVESPRNRAAFVSGQAPKQRLVATVRWSERWMGYAGRTMGLMASAECGSCGLKAEQLHLDIGMSPVFSFVSNALSYCSKCEALTTEPRLKSADNIRAVIKYLANSHPQAEHLVEIAEAIATAIERKCGTCGTKQKDVRYREGSAKPIKCPRCTEKALRLEPVGIWD